MLDDRRDPGAPDHLLDDVATRLLGVREAEVDVEARSVGRHPRHVPAHAAPVRRQLLDRCAGREHERHVAGVEVGEEPVDRVGDRRVHRVAGLVARPEHEVVDEELRATVEQLVQRPLAVLGVEAVVLLDPHPGEGAALARQLVAQARVLLLADEQRLAGGEPLVAGADSTGGHRGVHGVLLNVARTRGRRCLRRCVGSPRAASACWRSCRRTGACRRRARPERPSAAARRRGRAPAGRGRSRSWP